MEHESARIEHESSRMNAGRAVLPKNAWRESGKIGFRYRRSGNSGNCFDRFGHSEHLFNPDGEAHGHSKSTIQLVAV
jgi:hypothetical protein